MALRLATHLSLCLLLLILPTFSQAGVVVPAKRDGLTACLAGAKVPYVSSSSSDWAVEIEPYNLRLNYTPAAVAIPTSVAHIQAAVKCGASNNVRVSAKAGGHSYGSYGLGGEDGHLVIQLDRMYNVTLFASNNTAKIQPGARLGHVAVELYNQGGRAIAHGSCPGVGVAGHVLHGGYGFASRTHGLTLDFLIGASVVLADGSLVHCSAAENEDLFWALRGAGSSFGVVAELEFDTFAAPAQVTPFSIDLDWNENQAASGIEALQDLAAGAPKELNIQIYWAPGGQTIQGVYYGTVAQLNAVLEPLLDDIDMSISEATTMGWLEGLTYYAGEDLDQTYPYDEHTTNYKSGLLTKALTESQRKSFASALFANANNSSARHSWFILLDVIGGAHSAVASIASSATAYPHRDALFLYQFSDSGSRGAYPAAGFALLKGFRESITRGMAAGEWGMYANYLDTQIDSGAAQELYWGSNLARLRSIKADVDPGQVFWNPQAVSPAGN